MFDNGSGIANLYSLHSSSLGIGTISLYAYILEESYCRSAKARVYTCYVALGVRVRDLLLPRCGSECVARRAALARAVRTLRLCPGAGNGVELGFLEKLTFLQSFTGLNKYGGKVVLVNFTTHVFVLFGASIVAAVHYNRHSSPVLCIL
jgi:hypothetical protein